MSQPNILLIVTDQQRGDCLGISGHPVLQTPYLDEIAASVIRFSRGYSACPVCVPARRTLMTGQKAASHGVFMNHHSVLDGPTLADELSKSGYQTHLVGKLHLYPCRKLYVFNSADWADSPTPNLVLDDYERFLISERVIQPRAGLAHGISVNGYVARPFHLEERFHFTNWCADNAIRFLERRDPTSPFFLKLSFHQPHQPLTPPTCYYERYINMDLPEPAVADWARIYNQPQRGLPVNAWRVYLEPNVQQQMQAGYYGCINHIDNQIGRVLEYVPQNTVIVFVSDHGEMLGEHQWIRKRNAFEGSTHIPFLIHLPKNMGIKQEKVIDKAVELMDVMPTLLDIAEIEIPSSVDGQSLLPLIHDEDIQWRNHIHGECAQIPTLNSGMQYLTDGKSKYIWYPGLGQEQFFDLEHDPNEMNNLINNPDYTNELDNHRSILINQLKDRPEGFVNNGTLVNLGKPTSQTLPSYE